MLPLLILLLLYILQTRVVLMSPSLVEFIPEKKSRLVMAIGKGTPPKELENDSEVIKMVAANPNTIGFVSASAVSDDVKVVLNF